MLKAVVGDNLLLIGLSHANLDKLRADGLRGFIKIEGKPLGLPVDVIITAGETEQAIMQGLAEFVGPDTKVNIDPRLKS